MLGNYIKMAVRNLIKLKFYTMINIIGLAIGMASTILIFLFVRYELSYDKHHKNSEQIYRITREWYNDDGSTSIHFGFVAPPVAPLLQNDFPEIEQATRIIQSGRPILKYKETQYTLDMMAADPNVFDVFTFPLLKGNPETALQIPNGIVLSESSAGKLFGNEDPINKTLVLAINKELHIDLIVTGIMQDLPDNSHFHFDALNSMLGLKQFQGEEEFQNWGSNNYATYILLQKGQDIKQIQNAMPGFLDKHLGPNAADWNMLHFQKLTDIHLHSHLDAEFEQNGNIIYVYVLSLIAFMILLLATINFINLTTAHSSTKIKEIGIKKVIGANRTQIIFQYITESLMLSFISLLTAIILIFMLAPVLKNFLGIVVLTSEIIKVGGPLVAAILLVCAIAGGVPALFFANTSPSVTFKSHKSGGALARKVLVIFQFTISITLIICLAVIYHQINYCHQKDLGFDKHNLMTLQASDEMVNHYETLKTRLLQNPGVIGVTLSQRVPSAGLADAQDARIIKNQSLGFRLARVNINYDFLDVYGIDLVTGRALLNSETDMHKSFLINETAAKQIGWTAAEAVGKPIQYGGINGYIIGVVNDFHYESFHKPIAPFIMMMSPGGFNTITLKLLPQTNAKFQATTVFLKEIWQEYFPNNTFEYRFLDERFNQLYRPEQKQGKLLAAFALLAVLISCLGLLGLVTFFTEKKVKEIGIRKTLGATVLGLIYQLTRNFMIWIITANIIAIPIAWYAMNNWLQNFSYRIDLTVWPFVLAGFSALCIAALTISWQTIRAARGNPVEALRYE